ncbi:hypothetical protein Mgra_00010127 [Meloidogyne graminicola]|uniref:Uncharacterized protein n=1 Tax=Meloidogyne graminicola TaxID=189291 RepID=A0A8S9ZA71_9BILA|nr:hypothetical protein Mgra_00010127 [Meloidogyne graminicola]
MFFFFSQIIISFQQKIQYIHKKQNNRQMSSSHSSSSSTDKQQQQQHEFSIEDVDEEQIDEILRDTSKNLVIFFWCNINKINLQNIHHYYR